MSKARTYDREDAWLVFARLADLALREGVSVGFKLENPSMRSAEDFRTAARDFSVTLRAHGEANAIEAFRPLTPQERETLAERMFTAWAERAQRDIRPAASPELVEVFNRGECATCGARSTMPCVPVHAGERDAGDWAHPARSRQAERELRPHPRALQIAADIVRRRSPLTRDVRMTQTQRDQLLCLAISLIAYARHDAFSQAKGAPTAAEVDYLLGLSDISGHPSPRARPWTFDQELEDYPTPTGDDRVDAVPYSLRAVRDQLDRAERERFGRALNLETAIGRDLDHLAAMVGIRRNASAETIEIESDQSLRARTLERYRRAQEIADAPADPGRFRLCPTCRERHDTRVACPALATADNVRRLRALALEPAPGTSRRCTCHTNDPTQHAGGCPMAGQTQTGDSK